MGGAPLPFHAPTDFLKKVIEDHDIDAVLANRLKKPVGFRNIAVHNYEAIDWAIMHAIARNHIRDFSDFAGTIGATLDKPN